MQTLTIKKVKAAARKAYREKRLTAQHPKASQRVCVYRRGKYGCAVGVGLTKATLKLIGELINGCPVERLEDYKCVAIADDDRKQIVRCQRFYDRWCFSRERGASYAETEIARRAFLELIGLKSSP